MAGGSTPSSIKKPPAVFARRIPPRRRDGWEHSPGSLRRSCAVAFATAFVLAGCTASMHSRAATSSEVPISASFEKQRGGGGHSRADRGHEYDTADQSRCREHCQGVERWEVKVGLDAGASAIDVAAARLTSIHDFASCHSPLRGSSSTRIAPIETRAYVIRDVEVTAYKLEGNDEDFHLAIDDGAGETMIAEIPRTGCVDPRSPWTQRMTTVRAAFVGHFRRTPCDRFVEPAQEEIVSIMGVGFFDRCHGQRGVAPNAVEIHPVLAICFGRECWRRVPEMSGAASITDAQLCGRPGRRTGSDRCGIDDDE